MANTSRPNGFRFAKGLLGNAEGIIRRYKVADRTADTVGNHGDVYVGDPVKISAAGLVLVANTGDTVLGIVVGVGAAPMFGEAGMFDPANLMKQHLLHTETGGYVWVIPAEGALFEVQEATALALVEGQAADLNTAANTAHGSRVTSLSNVEIVTSINADVRIVERQTAPDNDDTITKGRFIVQFVKIVHGI